MCPRGLVAGGHDPPGNRREQDAPATDTDATPPRDGGGHGLRREAAVVLCMVWLRSRRWSDGTGSRLGNRGTRGGEVRGKIVCRAWRAESGDLYRVEFFSVFRGAGGERCLFAGTLGFAFLFRGDGLAEATGLLTGESIGNSLGDGGFLRVTDQHVRPRVCLRKRVGSADKVQAAQNQKQVAEEKLQI